MFEEGKVYGDDLMGFVRLSSGHWAGDDWQNVYVSQISYAEGNAPFRFKHVEFVLASADQAAEYNAIRDSLD